MPEYKKNTKYAVVIPAYNEEATIYDVTQRALKQCDKVIVVDDGSSDRTIVELDDLPVILIKHEINQGKAASLWDGFLVAIKEEIDVIITLDGDGQHAPEDIPLLVEKSELHPEQIIIGARLADKAAIPAKRYYANKIANFWIAWAAGYPLSDSQSGFRLYPVSLFQDLIISTSRNNSFVFESEILIKAAQRGIYSQHVTIPAVYAPNARPSHFRGVRDISLITLMVGKSLFSRGMYLQGLYRSVFKPALLPAHDDKSDSDGYLTMLLSLLLILITGGISLLMSWAYVFIIARRRSNHQKLYSTLLLLGKHLQNGQPDHDYRSRLHRAARLLNTKEAHCVYITGGKTRNTTVSEASAGKIFLVQKGVDARVIFIEEDSRNTLENLKKFSALSEIDNKHVSLITNRYHLARSLIMAKGFGINAQPCPAEERFSYAPKNIIKTFIEAAHLHWYIVGKYWAKLTNNTQMLDRLR